MKDVAAMTGIALPIPFFKPSPMAVPRSGSLPAQATENRKALVYDLVPVSDEQISPTDIVTGENRVMTPNRAVLLYGQSATRGRTKPLNTINTYI